MEYYARFSVISKVGFVGIEDKEFDAESIEELETMVNEFVDAYECEHRGKIDCLMLDELEDEDGCEMSFEINVDTKKYMIGKGE